MTEKEIKTEIFEKLNQGSSKSELFAHYKEKINDNTLRKVLASRPSFASRKKYKTAHLLLSIIWGLFIFLELFGMLDLIVDFDIKFFFSLIVSIFIAVNIWKFDGRFFIPGIIWFVFTIFDVFREIDSSYVSDSDYGTVLVITSIYALILSVGIYLMYYLKKNVFGYYNWLQPISKKNDNIKFE